MVVVKFPVLTVPPGVVVLGVLGRKPVPVNVMVPPSGTMP